LSSTDKEWERIAQTEPFFGVLTNQQFLTANLNAEAEKRFWASGERHISTVFNNIAKHLQSNFAPQRVLDFGCGIGRLIKPLTTVLYALAIGPLTQWMLPVCTVPVSPPLRRP
jgi:hypothetical protein